MIQSLSITLRIVLLISATLFGLAGCGSDGGSSEGGEKEAHNPGPDGHTHDDEGDDHHGDPHPLGKLIVEGYQFEVVQFGESQPGKEIAVELTLTEGAEPTSIRTWVGTNTGVGARKAKAEKEEGGHYHAHVELPPAILPNHALWIEVQEASGKRVKASLSFHRS